MTAIQTEITQPAPGLFDIIQAPANIDDLPIPKNPYYVVDTKGFLIHKNTRLGRVLVRLEKDPPTLKAIDRSTFWHKIPPIGAELLGQVLGFFNGALAKKSEAMVLLFIDKNDDYSVLVPEQEADYTGIDYKMDKVVLPDDKTLIGTIHSHCDFSAFQSHTDEGDMENRDGIHITIGMVNKDIAEFDVAIAFNDVIWTGFKPNDLGFEPKDIKPLPYPKDWLENVKPVPPKPMTMSFNLGDPTQRAVANVLQNHKRSDYGRYGYDDYDSDEIDAYYRSWKQQPSAKILPAITDDMYEGLGDQFAAYLAVDLKELALIARDHGYELKFKIDKMQAKPKPSYNTNTPQVPPEGKCIVCGTETYNTSRGPNGEIVCFIDEHKLKGQDHSADAKGAKLLPLP